MRERMTRPVAVTAVAIVEAFLAICGLVVAREVIAAATFPSWFNEWMILASASHLISAFFLWRLSWLAPLLFVLTWTATFLVGQIVPHDPSLTAIRLIFAASILVAYLTMVWKYRTLFSLHRISTHE